MSTVVGLVLLAAHPLGDFAVNQYAGLRLGAGAVTVDYVLDLAELPAYQARAGMVDPARWAADTCASVAAATDLRVGSARAPVRVTASSVTTPPGRAGLPTVRLECSLRAAADLSGEVTVAYRNRAYPDRPGWREVSAAGDGVTLVSSDVPAASASGRLSAYPAGAAVPDVRSATVRVAPGRPDPAAAAAPAGSARPDLDRLTASFTGLVGRPELSLGLGLLAVALAVLLGAVHAFAPGHGKTVLAAYLVAERGSLRHALAVAGTVTLTHTAGVLALGAVLTTAVRCAPQRLYDWLGAASGLLVAGLGAAMLRRARRWHGHGHHHHHPGRLRDLLAMGLAGGLAPSPSAIVVLLGAVALGRTWFGVLLVLGYGLGMAAALAGLGAVLARWRPVFERRMSGRTGRWAPVVAAALVLVVGLGLAARSVTAL